MKYGLGIRLLISFVAGGLAVMYKVKVNPQLSQAEVSSVINVPREFLFDILTEPKNVPAYFSWVTKISTNDKRNVVVGKRYKGIVNLPFLGQHKVSYKVADCQDGAWMVLRPEVASDSYFNTEVILMLNSISNTTTQFYMKVIYHRNSALFQLTLGKFLWWLTDQQLRQTSLNVRTLAMSKWKKFNKGKPVDDKKLTVDLNDNEIVIEKDNETSSNSDNASSSTSATPQEINWPKNEKSEL